MGMREKIDLKIFCQSLIANSYPEMKLLIDEKVQSVSCHPQLLTQTLLDLFDNAFDASKDQVQLAIYQDNDFIHFEVINREAIISPEVLSKLGEPFNIQKNKVLVLVFLML